MDAEHLSQRLATVAAFVPAGARLADIGSDHAYLPAALALQGKIAFALAGEVVKGPYENAVREVQRYQLDNLVHPRLADGLTAVQPADQIDTIVIAGMGGTLITNILDAGQEKLGGVKRLILQPNVGEPRLRRWLADHNFQIMAERLVAEDGHIYEIIMAEPTPVPVRYSDYELLFGPHLLEKKDPVFLAKWQDYIARQEKVIQQMQAAKQVPTAKIEQLQDRLAIVREAIK